MAYDIMTVTSKGVQVFAQLSGNQNEHLIIEGCDADTNVKTQDQAVAVENRPSSPTSTTTRIVLSGVTNSSFLVYAQFVAGQTTGGQVNSFYLYGYLQSAPNTKFVIAVASDSRQTKLPDTQDIINYVEVRFSLTFTPIQNASQVGVPSDQPYVLRSEFLQNMNTVTTQINTLSDRVVTTHVEGTPTTGENQTIYGVKWFYDQLRASSIECGDVTSSSITPLQDNAYDIGSSNNRFRDAFFTGNMECYGLQCGSISIDGNISLSEEDEYDLGSSSDYWRKTYTKELYVDTIKLLPSSQNTKFTLYDGINPYEDESISLGSRETAFSNISTHWLYVTKLQNNIETGSSNNEPIKSYSSIVPYALGGINMPSLGNPSYYWGNGYITYTFTQYLKAPSGIASINVNSDLVPQSGDEMLGDESHYWDVVYASNVKMESTGYTNTLSSGRAYDITLPLGSLALVEIYVNSSYSGKRMTGSVYKKVNNASPDYWYLDGNVNSDYISRIRTTYFDYSGGYGVVANSDASNSSTSYGDIATRVNSIVLLQDVHVITQDSTALVLVQILA